MFRAENNLSSSSQIDPVRFSERFPGSKALVELCPADKYRAVQLDTETVEAGTLVVFDDFSPGPNERYDWLHNNVAGKWSVIWLLWMWETFGEEVTVVCFESEDDAILFRCVGDGRLVAGHSLAKALRSDHTHG